MAGEFATADMVVYAFWDLHALEMEVLLWNCIVVSHQQKREKTCHVTMRGNRVGDYEPFRSRDPDCAFCTLLYTWREIFGTDLSNKGIIFVVNTGSRRSMQRY